MPSGDGGSFWRPSSLADVYDMPERVLHLMGLFLAGVAAGRDPWGWWRTTASGPYDPAATREHLYRSAWQEPHQAPARCGYAPPDGAAWARADGDARCRSCSGERDQEQGSGSIGGIDIATRQRTEG